MTIHTEARSTTTTRTETFGAAVLALVLGTFLVFAAGFVNSETVHNAAHDTRHSFAFPCH